MDPQIATDTPVNQAEIQKLAYFLWENAHCPAGRALEFWTKAEQTLHARRSAAAGPFIQAARADSTRTRPRAIPPILKTTPNPAPAKPRPAAR